MGEHMRDGEGPQRSAADDSLGSVIASFKTSFGTRFMLILCGVVMVACGLFLAFYPAHGRPVYLGQALVGGGVLVLVLAVGFLPSQRVLICSGGIQRLSRRRQERYRWAELSEITSVDVKRGLVTGRHCVLVGRDGTRLVIGDLAIGQYDEMLATLREVAVKNAVPWKDERVTK